MNGKFLFSFLLVCGLFFHPIFSQDPEAENVDSQEMGFFGWSVQQDEKDPSHKYFLITGCARSGMVYTKRALMRSNLKKQGLIRNRHWMVSWTMATGCKKLAKEPSNEVTFEHIFHQVRNPLDVISSLYTCFDNTDGVFWKFVRTHVSEIKEGDPLIIQCAKYWYYWNLRCEKMAEYRYRVEDIEGQLGQFKKRAGVIVNQDFLSQLPTNYNHWWTIREKFTWAKLKKELPPDIYYNLQKMAKKYGYSTKD